MKKVLLSFDIEEFDMPLEYQRKISFEDQISTSRKGTQIILDILKEEAVNATFFSTVIFANEVPDLISRIKSEGHELGSHSFFHSSFKDDDIAASKHSLEKLSGLTIHGFRMPRMMPVRNEILKEAGFRYNSSLNPTYLPGRYNHIDKPRTVFIKEDIIQLPASVTPLTRFPLFWLSFHNLPLSFYSFLCKRTIERDGYLNLYFHPWEFTDLTGAGLPSYVIRNSGIKMEERFRKLIKTLKAKGYYFSTISDFLGIRG